MERKNEGTQGILGFKSQHRKRRGTKNPLDEGERE